MLTENKLSAQYLPAMRLLHKLQSYYYVYQSRRYSRKALKLHNELRAMMTPYMRDIDYCDKQANKHRILAVVAAGRANNVAVPKLDYSSDIGSVVEQ